MNDLINRYIYDVTRRLPKEEREQVSLELSSQIQDMLPNEPTEEQIKSVLQDLGNPALLAEQYHANPRYLISPTVYSDYISVLWRMGIVMVIISIIFLLLNNLFGIQPGYFTFASIAWAVVGGILGGALIGAMITFTFVTLGFIIYTHFNKSKKETEWSVDTLPKVEKEKEKVRKFNKGLTISELVLTIIVGGLLISYFAFFHKYLGWMDADNVTDPIFNAEIMQTYLLWIILAVALVLILVICKLRFRQWTPVLLIYNFITQVGIAAVAVSFLNNSNTFNNGAIERTAEYTGLEVSQIVNYLDTGILIASIFFIVCAVIAVAIPVFTWHRNKQANFKLREELDNA